MNTTNNIKDQPDFKRLAFAKLLADLADLKVIKIKKSKRNDNSKPIDSLTDGSKPDSNNSLLLARKATKRLQKGEAITN
jgi:hypothetical protein